MNGITREVGRWLARCAMLLVLAPIATADNFAAVRFDRQTDQLIVTMAYRGTNPDHRFSLRWGECLTDDSGRPASVTAEVLDDQWEDAAEADYETTTRFSLSELPCARPASVTLRTAPRFLYTVSIP